MGKDVSSDDLFWPAFLLCAFLTVGLLWTVKYPPLVDLPQHAAQVKLWLLMEQGTSGYSDEYEWNSFAPYLSCYFAGRLLSAVFPVPIAMKLFVTLAVLALPLAMLRVLRRTGGDRWWSLAGFALAFSFNFYWGLLNFLVAVPLSLLLVSLAFSYAQQPTARRGGWIAFLSVVLFLTHGLVCGFTLLVAGAVILTRSPQLRTAVRGQIPLLPAAFLGTGWFLATRRSEAQAAQPPAWNLSWERLLDLPGTLLGSALDIEAQLVGGLLLLLFLTSLGTGGTSRREGIARFLPLGLALGFFLLGPEIFFRAAFLNSRFVVFVLPLALFAVRRKAMGDLQRCVLTLLVVGWLFNLYPRFQAFDIEAQTFDALLEVMEPQRRVLGLIFEPFPEGFDTPLFLHHHAWYQAEKGGHVDFSFAYFYVQPIRYRPDHTPRVPDSFSWRPTSFDPAVHGEYDYYVVRSAEDPEEFWSGRLAVVPRVHSGDWWLYERAR